MKHPKYYTLIALMSAFSIFLSAQNIQISYTNCDALFVCSTDTFTVTVKNNTAVPLNAATLNLGLPGGLTYVANTVAGASQQNISNLSSPVFGLPDMPVNQFVTIQVLLQADCSAADKLDAGQLFVVQILVNSPLGNEQVNTSSIPVETGAIVIKSISGQILSGERGDTLLRTICVENTRLGKIGSLYFEDNHLEGFDVSVESASSQINGLTLFSAEFEGGFFTNVGNGDRWLDQNENVCFTERIILNSCGIPSFTNSSLLRVGWGCGGQVCRYDSTVATIQILPSTQVPELVFEPIWSPPTDYCGNAPAVMGFKAKNIGKAAAINVIFNLTQTEALGKAGIVTNSFRIVDGNGSTPFPANITQPTFLMECQRAEVRSGSFVFPLITAGDSLSFLFDVITCVEPCEQVQPAFQADYFYKKDCPINGFVSGFTKLIPEDRYGVRGELKSLVGACMDSGNSYSFSYEAVGKYLIEDGFWHLNLVLPIGITLEDSCGNLLGDSPPALVEITSLTEGGQNLHFAWATPLALDSLVMNFCLRYDCDTSIVCLDLPDLANTDVVYTEYCCFLDLKNNTFWTPSLQTEQSCGINACTEQLIAVNLDCRPDGDNGGGDSTEIIPNIPVPGLKDWWDAYRLNLGFEDSQDDRSADLPLALAGNQARRDRFLAGDTLRVEYCAVVDSAVSVDTIVRLIWHEIVGSDMGTNDNDIFLTTTAKESFVDAEQFRFLQNTIRVRYADGTEATCIVQTRQNKDKNYFQLVNPNAFPLVPIDDVASQRDNFLFSLPNLFAAGCLPRPALELGDSIFIFSDYKLDINFKPSSSNHPDPPLVGFRTATSGGGFLYAWNQQPNKKLQYSGWKKELSSNTHSIKPCENSTEVRKFRYSMRIARENMFPFEVRPLASISDYQLTTSAGLELASAQLEYLTLQDSVPVYNNLPLPFSQQPGFVDIDFAPAFETLLDEGFTLRTRLNFKPNCQFELPDSSKQLIQTGFTGCLNGDQMTVLDSFKNSIGFFSNTPKLQLLTDDLILYSPSRSFEIDLDLKNLLVPSAPASWIAVVSPSGQISAIELFQLPQNQPITGTNNLFNLGTINGFSQRNFRLKGQNISCKTDSLLLIFGWGCTPLSSLEDATCGRDTLLIQMNLELPELELDILQEPASFVLCDSSEYFEFEIYNAKTGYVYDLDASLKLPPGLQIVSGSCQISYPEGAPWVNIADPNMIAANLYQWDINSVLPMLATNGLPGVNLSPQNALRIRFKTLAECGFVANTQLIYGTSGVEPCGRPANTLNKPGEILGINGLEPDYGVQLSIQPIGNPANSCGDAQRFEVSLNILGTPSQGDSVYILLPQGVSLFINSYVPGVNAPAGPVTFNAQGFQLALPILQGGGLMKFGFQVLFGATAGCNDPLLLVQTRVLTETFCQSLGALCPVYLSTGETSWNISLQHPQLAIANAILSIENGLVQGGITITNTGNVLAPGATAQIWRDIDGNGTLSSNDVLLETLQTDVPIAVGASVQLSGNLAGLDSTQLCGLLWVIPAAENCTCEDQFYLLENVKLQHTALIFCNLESISLGVPEQSGFTYTWETAAGLSCTSCPNTIFTPDENTPPGTPQTLILKETSDACSIEHRFEVSFGAFAQIMTGNTTLCEGNSSVLTASPAGTGYVWQGPGIQNPTQQSQTVQPPMSATYSVTITFSNGCTASDTTGIIVLNSDTLQLPGLVTCAGEAVEILGTNTSTPGTYQLVFPGANGCDSTILQTLTVLPKPETEENQVFCVGDSLLIWDSLFTESGEICRIFSAFNGCDSTHCITVTAKELPVLTAVDTIFGDFGQIITLEGPGGFVTYVWEPTPTPPCLNCPTVTFPADSSGYQEYRLQVADADGCAGELVFRIVIFPPCSADSLKIPNVFTPNGDGANDVFRVVSHEGAEVVSKLEIYSRWGEKVYESYGNAAWDGTSRGKPAPSDVYVYIVEVTCGELIGRRVGDVTLLR
jgi:gliding motility-associated-like protein/uncharacterized repeat protein (TIGR01451 family)